MSAAVLQITCDRHDEAVTVQWMRREAREALAVWRPCPAPGSGTHLDLDTYNLRPLAGDVPVGAQDWRDPRPSDAHTASREHWELFCSEDDCGNRVSTRAERLDPLLDGVHATGVREVPLELVRVWLRKGHA